MYKYPEQIRRMIYTTNAIENFNRQLRKVTKTKSAFVSDDALLKQLYLVTMQVTSSELVQNLLPDVYLMFIAINNGL